MKPVLARLPAALALVAALLPLAATALPKPWAELDGKTIPLVGLREIAPAKARYFAVKPGTFEAMLSRATETTLDRNVPATLRLPLPDGRELSFRVVLSPVMAPALAAKYPMIKTYAGVAANDPGITGRFQMDPRGFRGMIFTPEGTVYIDPYSRGDTRNYQVYYRQDLPDRRRSPDTLYQPQKLSKPAAAGTGPLLPTLANRGVSIAGDLRTYRLALAATYQYSSYHDPVTATNLMPRKSVVLAEQANVVNRVTGVYEREVGIRLVLIPNNDQLIFNTPAQPYPDYDPTGLGSGTAMVETNTTVIDTIIGSANYDIGHVSSTGGGGIAGLGVVCNTMNKGAGVTGLSTPVGDGYYIDFVAHEMGHQFGANHTFNGNQSTNCSSNSNAATSYEPGSGITIMGYAGVCGADDLAPHSIDTFHGASFDEIVNYSRNDEGNTCAVKTTTKNSPPRADAGVGGFTIPKQTPFELTAAGCDPDNDTITYQWEEFDLGPAGAPNAGATTAAPIFRDFLPTTSPTRIFPQLSDLLNNTQTIGEILPSPASSRAMKFRLVVRDNKVYPLSGGVSSADLAFTVTGAAGPFLVTFPNTAQTFNGKQTVTSTWNVAGTTAAPVSCPNVDIYLSSDGGNTFPTLLLAGTPNDGSQEVVLPDIDTTKARLKVKCASNVFFDISNANFTIKKLANTAPVAKLAATPVKGTAPVTVRFDATGSSDAEGAVAEYRLLPGNGDAELVQSTPSFSVTYAQAGSYTATLTVKDAEGLASESLSQLITVLAPVGNTAPVARLTATPTSGTAPLAVQFSAAGSSDPDSGDSIASYSYDFDGDGTNELQDVNSATASKTFSQPGEYDARLIVKDSKGLASAPVTVHISVSAAPATNPAPTLSNTAPVAVLRVLTAEGQAPLVANFSLRDSYDSDGNDYPAQFRYDFGDGSAPVTTQMNERSHVYSTAGRYVARFTVFDSHGAASDEKSATITVAAAAATPAVSAASSGGAAGLALLAGLTGLGALRRRSRRR